MTTEDHNTKVRRLSKEAFNNGNLDALDELAVPNVIHHQPPMPDVVGLAAYKQMVADIRKGLSDINFTFDDMIIEGDKAAGRWTLTGTHTGPLPNTPIPPTGKRVTMTAVSFVRLMGDKIVEEWAYVDMLGYMQQLGVAPK